MPLRPHAGRDCDCGGERRGFHDLRYNFPIKYAIIFSGGGDAEKSIENKPLVEAIYELKWELEQRGKGYSLTPTKFP